MSIYINMFAWFFSHLILIHYLATNGSYFIASYGKVAGDATPRNVGETFAKADVVII